MEEHRASVRWGKLAFGSLIAALAAAMAGAAGAQGPTGVRLADDEGGAGPVNGASTHDGASGAGETEFLGLEVEWFAGRQWFEHGYVERWTFRIYAVFTPGQDNGVLLVFGDAEHPLTVQTDDPGGFYNDQFGGLTAPIDIRRAGFWSNQWDTYVTLGAVAAAGDATLLSTGFAEESGGLSDSFTSSNIGWYITPGEPQGLPDEDGRVLLAQFTTGCGRGIVGSLSLLLIDGTYRYDYFFTSFEDGAREAGGATAAGGGDCNQNCHEDVLDLGGPSRDCNGNGTPDECEGLACVYADLDCDGAVTFEDLLAVLADWGPCSVCDEDIDLSGAVDFGDLLAVLAGWGECA